MRTRFLLWLIGHAHENEEDLPPDESDQLFTEPRPALFIGLGMMLLAVLVSMVGLKGAWVGVPLAAGALAMGVGVAIQPRRWWVLALANIGLLIGIVAIPFSGLDESILYLFYVANVLAFFAFVLICLSSVVRKVGVSLLILFHFGGILTAVVSAPPQPWIAGKIWLYVYRPYLEFTYLNNAYHFYAPEPGPANLMWYRVSYEPNQDGSTNYRWVKVPDMRDGSPIDFGPTDEPRRYPYVEFTRRLSLAMSAAQTSLPGGSPTFGVLKMRREARGRVDGIPEYPVGLLPLERQYREPNYVSKRWIASYARHVARTYKHGVHPEKKVTGVKVYIMEHLLIRPNEFGTRTDPASGKTIEPRKLNDPTLWVATYLGDFDADGVMKPECHQWDVDRATGNKFDVSMVTTRDGRLLTGIIVDQPRLAGPQGEAPSNRYVIQTAKERITLALEDVVDEKPMRDPYLYWVMPILYHGQSSGQLTEMQVYKYLPVDNYMKKQAGDPDWENQPWENQP